MQRYSWIAGEDTDQLLLPLEAVLWNETTKTGWLLFDDVDQFRFAYQEGSARHYRSDLKGEARTAQ